MKNIFTRSLVWMLVISLLMVVFASINVFALDVDAIPFEIGSETYFEGGETIWLSLTPEETGYYFIYSNGETDTVCTLYDSSLTMLDYSDDFSEYDLNFYFEAELISGSTYYLMIDTYDGVGGEFSVVVEKLPAAEELYIEPETDFSGFVGESQYFYAHFEPIMSQWEAVYWSVDDPEMVYLEDNDGSCTVRFLEEGTTILRAYTDSGLSAFAKIEGIKTPELFIDTEVQVSVFENDGNAFFQFTPEEDGVYTFYSKGDADADGLIYSSDGWLWAYNYESGEMLNFQVTRELFAGETYYLESKLYTFTQTDSTEYTVGITKTPATQGVVIECLNNVSGYIGDECMFSALFLPVCSEAEYCTWTVADENVAEVYYEDTECVVTFIGEGKTTLTVTTESGFTDSVEIECLPVPVLNLNETVSVTVDAEGYDCHKFIPEEDGIYVFYAEGKYSTTATLTDSDMNYLASPIGLGIGENFVIQYELYAGEEYYLFSNAVTSDGEADAVDKYTYDITVSLATEAEGVKIDDMYQGEVIYDKLVVGDIAGYIAVFSPVTALMEDCIWTVDKEGIIEIQDLSEYGLSHFCMVEAIGEGTVTITVETIGGHKAEITITVYGEYLMGDVDGSGDVGGKDSNILKQYLAGAANTIHELNADMNMDGSVDAKDSNLLKQYISGAYDPEIEF